MPKLSGVRCDHLLGTMSGTAELDLDVETEILE